MKRLRMKVNKEKRIGRVLFIVEGSRYEFSLLQKIFVGVFQYEYLEKRRSRPARFISGTDKFSRIAVVNTRESNIKDITENEQFLDDVFEMLLKEYDYPVDQSAIYYLFDRDPESNNDSEQIRNYISILRNPYENDGFWRAGQLLLSYPSVESYTITAFDDKSDNLRFMLGKEAKQYIAGHTDIQLNKVDENALIKAAEYFLKYIDDMGVTLDLDEFEGTSMAIFNQQDIDYCKEEGFRLFSMLTLSLLQLGLTEMI